VPASIDFASIRAGIANVLETIPEVKRVNPYDPGKVEAAGNLPYATVERNGVTGPGLSIYGEDRGDEGLGQYTHLIVWTIRIYASIRSRKDAQEHDDLYTARLLDAFNADRLLDPNGPGVVDNSRLIEIQPFEEFESTRAVWVTIATLQTKVISTR
jgi:hypothetical protein